jgi:D-apionolactonase
MESIRLSFGPLTMTFEPGTGMLRHLRLGDREVLRGIYSAVRFQDWSTAPHDIRDLRVEQNEAGFEVKWTDISGPVAWSNRIQGDGTRVVYEADGLVTADFETNRTGICVLHPAKEGRGARCRVTHTDGQIEESAFPDQISPHQPFFDMTRIEHEVIQGTWASVEFEGEVFEMEDQRNWTDASFKTYCRPLSRPRPYPLRAGERVKHVIRFSLEGVPEAIQPWSTHVRLSRSGEAVKRVSVGTVANLDLVPSPIFSHYAVPLGKRDSIASWLADNSTPIHWLVQSGSAEDVRGALETWPNSIAMVNDLAMIRELNDPGKIFTGTSGNFTEMNRERPDCDFVAGLGFATDAQVHAFDEVSIVETIEGLEHVIETARDVCPGKPIRVGPIRFGPESDSRRRSPFGVAWTLALIASLSASGVESATIFGLEDWLDDHFGPVRDLLGYPTIEPLHTIHRLEVIGFIAGGETWLVSLVPQVVSGVVSSFEHDTEFELKPYEILRIASES